jgi:hypothetical protein
MPIRPENKTLVNIIKNFMDEFITRYNVFEEFQIDLHPIQYMPGIFRILMI